MNEFKDLFQAADWKKEKHAPVIELPDRIKKGELFPVKISVGKEIPHPNKTEHHISWVEVYFQPEGNKFPYQIGKTSFTAHGASTEGADSSSVYTQPETVLRFKTDKAGTIFASSYCNIHGLWQNSAGLKIE